MSAVHRSRRGQWEGDTVAGAIGKACLVTLVDRKSRDLVGNKNFWDNLDVPDVPDIPDVSDVPDVPDVLNPFTDGLTHWGWVQCI